MGWQNPAYRVTSNCRSPCFVAFQPGSSVGGRGGGGDGRGSLRLTCGVLGGRGAAGVDRTRHAGRLGRLADTEVKVDLLATLICHTQQPSLNSVPARHIS